MLIAHRPSALKSVTACGLLEKDRKTLEPIYTTPHPKKTVHNWSRPVHLLLLWLPQSGSLRQPLGPHITVHNCYCYLLFQTCFGCMGCHASEKRASGAGGVGGVGRHPHTFQEYYKLLWMPYTREHSSPSTHDWSTSNQIFEPLSAEGAATSAAWARRAWEHQHRWERTRPR